MSPHRPRTDGETLLATRHASAVLIHRHPDQVRRRCQPVACDAVSRALLYDLAAVEEAFRSTPRRAAG